MSNAKVATSPGTKDVFSPSKMCGLATGSRQFRSYSTSGRPQPNFAGIRADHRRSSSGPGVAAQNQQHHHHRQHYGGMGTGSGSVGAPGLKRRAGSFGGGGCVDSAGRNPSQFKRRKKEPGIVPPTKFLLGGNINDPLNLNSFEDEEVNRAINQVTPYSSPLPTPKNRDQVAVLIPPNINDPLNLNGGEGDIELDLVSPKTFYKRKRRKRRKTASLGDALEAAADGAIADVVKESAPSSSSAGVASRVASAIPAKDGPKSGEPRPNSLLVPAITVPHNSRSKKADDKIVSPVIPQPGTRKHRPSGHGRTISRDSDVSAREAMPATSAQRQAHVHGGIWPKGSEVAADSIPKKTTWRKSKAGQEKFRYGNYNRYYGYRNPGQDEDCRLSCLRREWLEGKEVLDLGCNVGHITISLARDFAPRMVFGMDIDPRLIDVARKNVSHYLTEDSSFPISMAVCYGPITTAKSLISGDPHPTFPNNVVFLQANYVFDSDDKLDSVKQEYDTILCLSVTKWIHLNWGDDGLKRLFKRIFKNLRPGGRLILEPQNWASYSKKKKLMPDFLETYQSIRLKPENFTEYLLSKEVGFSTCEVIDIPFNHSRGFQRPMQLFTKSESSPSSTPSEALRISQNPSPQK